MVDLPEPLIQITNSLPVVGLMILGVVRKPSTEVVEWITLSDVFLASATWTEPGETYRDPVDNTVGDVLARAIAAGGGGSGSDDLANGGKGGGAGGSYIEVITPTGNISITIGASGTGGTGGTDGTSTAGGDTDIGSHGSADGGAGGSGNDGGGGGGTGAGDGYDGGNGGNGSGGGDKNGGGGGSPGTFTAAGDNGQAGSSGSIGDGAETDGEWPLGFFEDHGGDGGAPGNSPAPANAGGLGGGGGGAASGGAGSPFDGADGEDGYADMTYQVIRERYDTQSPDTTFNYDATDRGDDLYFECDIVLPSSPSDGVIFEHGGGGQGAWVGVDDSGATLRIRAGDGAGASGSTTLLAYGEALTAEIAEFDGNVHKVAWRFAPDDGEVWLWIDDRLVIYAATTDGSALESNVWAGSNDGGYLTTNATVPSGENTTDWPDITGASDLRVFQV